MKRKLLLLLSLSGLLYSCITPSAVNSNTSPTEWLTIQLDSTHSDSVLVNNFTLLDNNRNRTIPVALYLPDSMANKQQLVVFSHGYGENKPGSNKGYSYLTGYLAAHGYIVASIQHELPDDELLPMTGNLSETRRPNWERGVQNIFFVVNELKQRMPNVDEKRVVVVGHSNGGDISMLYASEYPLKVSKAISLDNRRMPLPKTEKPKIYSLRANDLPADEKVLPTTEEQQTYGIKIISLPHTKHMEMSDQLANDKQKQEINTYILQFLKE